MNQLKEITQKGTKIFILDVPNLAKKNLEKRYDKTIGKMNLIRDIYFKHLFIHPFLRNFVKK